MSRRLCLLSSAVVMVAAAAFAPIAAEAQTQTSFPAPPAPPDSCVIAVSSSTMVTVQAGAGRPFPEQVMCPANQLGVVNCLRWRYKYELTGGNNISLSAVTTDTDLDIVAVSFGPPELESFGGSTVSSAGSPDSAIGIGKDVFDVRVVKFAAQGATILGNVYTRTNVGTGSVSAISKVGNAGSKSCRIAGADTLVNPAGVGNVAVTTMVVDEQGPCTIVRTVDPKGCTLDVEASSSDPDVTCTVTDEMLFINGQEVTGASCDTKLTSTGSTCTYYLKADGSFKKICF